MNCREPLTPYTNHPSSPAKKKSKHPSGAGLFPDLDYRERFLVSSTTVTMFLMLLAEVFRAGRTAAEQIYRNPVQAKTFRRPAIGTMGIGAPAVILHEGKYYPYLTGYNRSYRRSAGF